MTLAPERASAPGPDTPTRFRRLRVALDTRALLVSLAAVILLLALVIFSVLTSGFALTFGDVISTLTGHGTRAQEQALYGLNGPRIAGATLAGFALGMSGSIFQSVTRNPLGTPDIIGFTQGSAVGALIVLLVIGGTAAQTVVGALIGGLTVAAVVYLAAYRKGVEGYRLVLVGIGVSAILASLVALLLARAPTTSAQAAYVWLTGSLSLANWNTIAPLAIVLVVVATLAVISGRRMQLLEMGDDTAQALGVPAERTRLSLLAMGTILSACAVATVGPITFIALAAPQVSRRLVGSRSPNLLPAGIVGALLLNGSDQFALKLLPWQLPAGVATLILGGFFLAWILVRDNRNSRG